MELKIYFKERLTGKGEWIQFPLTVSEFEGRIRCICNGAPIGADHFMEITDVEGPKGDTQITTETFNFEEINELATMIEDIEEEDWEVVECLMENGYDLQRACRIVRCHGFLDLRDEWDDPETIVMAILDDDGVSLPDYIECNVDWYSAMEDLKNDEELYKCKSGWIKVY